MLKSLKAYSSNTFLAISHVDDSVSTCLITRQSVPLELIVGMFIMAVLGVELSMEESTAGERVLFLAYPSMFISFHLSYISSFHVSLFLSKCLYAQ